MGNEKSINNIEVCIEPNDFEGLDYKSNDGEQNFSMENQSKSTSGLELTAENFTRMFEMMQEMQRRYAEFQRLAFERFTATNTNNKTDMPSSSTFSAKDLKGTRYT